MGLCQRTRVPFDQDLSSPLSIKDLNLKTDKNVRNLKINLALYAAGSLLKIAQTYKGIKGILSKKSLVDDSIQIANKMPGVGKNLSNNPNYELMQKIRSEGRVATRDEIAQMIKNKGIDIKVATGDELLYYQKLNNKGGHWFSNGKSYIRYRPDATKWDLMHEYTHYLTQKHGFGYPSSRFPTVWTEENWIENLFLPSVKHIFKIKP